VISRRSVIEHEVEGNEDRLRRVTVGNVECSVNEVPCSSLDDTESTWIRGHLRRTATHE